MTHWIDVVHWYMNVDAPMSAVSHGAQLQHQAVGSARHVNVTLEFPKNFMAAYLGTYVSRVDDGGLEFRGERGTLKIDRARLAFYRDDAAYAPGTLTPEPEIYVRSSGDGTLTHLQNWLDCIRSRKTPNAHIRVAHQAARTSHIANAALRAGHRCAGTARRSGLRAEAPRAPPEDDCVAALSRAATGTSGTLTSASKSANAPILAPVLDDGVGRALFQVQDLGDLVGGRRVDRHAADLRDEVVVDDVELRVGGDCSPRDHLLGDPDPTAPDIAAPRPFLSEGWQRTQTLENSGGGAGRSSAGSAARRRDLRRRHRRAECGGDERHRDAGDCREGSPGHARSLTGSARTRPGGLPPPATTYCRPSSS